MKRFLKVCSHKKVRSRWIVRKLHLLLVHRQFHLPSHQSDSRFRAIALRYACTTHWVLLDTCRPFWNLPCGKISALIAVWLSRLIWAHHPIVQTLYLIVQFVIPELRSLDLCASSRARPCSSVLRDCTWRLYCSTLAWYTFPKSEHTPKFKMRRTFYANEMCLGDWFRMLFYNNIKLQGHERKFQCDRPPVRHSFVRFLLKNSCIQVYHNNARNAFNKINVTVRVSADIPNRSPN